jgi:hypothetical protein
MNILILVHFYRQMKGKGLLPSLNYTEVNAHSTNSDDIRVQTEKYAKVARIHTN